MNPGNSRINFSSSATAPSSNSLNAFALPLGIRRISATTRRIFNFLRKFPEVAPHLIFRLPHVQNRAPVSGHVIRALRDAMFSFLEPVFLIKKLELIIQQSTSDRDIIRDIYRRSFGLTLGEDHQINNALQALDVALQAGGEICRDLNRFTVDQIRAAIQSIESERNNIVETITQLQYARNIAEH